MELKNDRQVLDVLSPLLKDITDEIAGEILSIVQYYIESDVYGSGNIPHTYVRTNEFLNSWIKQVDASGRTAEVVATIFSDPSRMSLDLEHGVHGSETFGDLREELSEAIETGSKYSFKKIRKDRTWNPAAKKRRFFEHAIAELERNGFLFKLFEEELNARGFTIKKTNGINFL